MSHHDRTNQNDRREQDAPLGRVLVMMPPRLSESVMATAMLAALRRAHPEAELTVLIKRKLRPVLWGLDCVDEVLTVRRRLRRGDRGRDGRVSTIRLGRRLSRSGYDTALILPVGFRAAALAAVAGIPRRVGYEREGRAVLLTDRLVHRRHRGAMVPVPMLDRYLGIARYLGATLPMPNMTQRVSSAAEKRLMLRLASLDIETDSQPIALINPWSTDGRLMISPAALGAGCNQLVKQTGLQLIAMPSPKGQTIPSELVSVVESPIHLVSDFARDLHLLKAMVSRSSLVVTTDTGPRYLGAAMGRPVLTLLGSSADDDQSHTLRSHAGDTPIALGCVPTERVAAIDAVPIEQLVDTAVDLMNQFASSQTASPERVS